MGSRLALERGGFLTITFDDRVLSSIDHTPGVDRQIPPNSRVLSGRKRMKGIGLSRGVSEKMRGRRAGCAAGCAGRSTLGSCVKLYIIIA